MKPGTIAAVAQLPQLTVNLLRERYLDLFGEPTASRHKAWLVRRIAWRLQAQDEGGLSQTARQRAEALARDADIRLTEPRRPSDPAPILAGDNRTRQVDLPPSRNPGLAPGTLLRRVWRGRQVVVVVLNAGFEHEGRTYRSLSAVARAITGGKWNGFVFFGLKRPGTAA